MRDITTVIDFGIHKGKQLSDLIVPLSYIYWIGRRGSYHELGNRFECRWKVPVVLMVLARREWENRTGERWEGLSGIRSFILKRQVENERSE